jgi:FG-GAP-like repeat
MGAAFVAFERTSMKRSVVFLSVWAMALACVLGGLAAASASAQTPASAVAAVPVGVPVTLGGPDPSSLVINVTSTSDPSYPLNRQLAFDSANSTMSVQVLRDTEIRVSASTGLPYEQFSFDFYAPAGQKLHVGTYTGVYTNMGSDPDFAGLLVDFGSSSERPQGSEVEIRDLATDASGTVTRLDLVFRLNPARPANSRFGSIRFGQDETPDRTLSAHRISWPMSPVGAPRVLATESLHNTGTAPLNVGSAAVTGLNRADFTVTADSCSGRTLLPGQACPVVIGYTPTAAGRRSATLSLPINGETDTVELGGEAPPGFSRIVTSGNDYVSNGLVHDYVDGPYQLEVKGNRQRLMFAPTKVYDYQFDGLSVWLRGSGNQPMTIGVHPAENYFSGSQTAYGIYVSGLGRGCGTAGSINVKQLTYAPDGTLLTADIAFTQTCTSDSPGKVMNGEIKWRLPIAQSLPSPLSRLDFTGDGKADLIGAKSNGDLYLYRGNGLGGFTGPGTKIGAGWNIFVKVLSPGDFTGDGKADLIGAKSNGDLYLYRGNALGGFTGAGTKIGRGWNIFVKVLSPGDFTGDGKADLIGAKSNGDLYLYRGNGLGGFTGPGTKIGAGWNTFTQVF